MITERYGREVILMGRGLRFPLGNLVEVGSFHTLGLVQQSAPEIFRVQRA